MSRGAEHPIGRSAEPRVGRGVEPVLPGGRGIEPALPAGRGVEPALPAGRSVEPPFPVGCSSELPGFGLDELRRQVIAERTIEALASLRRQGVRLGRPRRCPDEVLLRVLAERESGLRLTEICARLNADGVPTPAGGGRWYPSHLSRLLRTQDAQRLRTAGT